VQGRSCVDSGALFGYAGLVVMEGLLRVVSAACEQGRGSAIPSSLVSCVRMASLARR
jgi:hypothetical protein